MLNHTFIRKSTWLLSLAISSAGITLTPAPAQAQLVLEEVIVTAQKRAESLQDVPISVAAMSGEKMEDNGILDLEELTQYMPNVNINQGRAQPNLFIRGVGSGTNAGFEQSVGMYIDGVYSGRGPMSNIPITWDVARVEVLKGPQGILFGKNTIGGAINITTNRPTQEFEGSIEALWEPDDNEQVYSGVISGGITDRVAGRVAVRYEGMDGWWDNKQLDEEGPDRDNLMIRTSLLWDVSDSAEVLFKYEHGDFETTSLPSVVYKSDQPINFRGESPFPLLDDQDEAAFDVVDINDTTFDTAVATVNWDLDFATFTSITAYSQYDLEKVRNNDFAAISALRSETDEDYEQFSQELRFVSPGGETLDWIAGAYFQSSELEITGGNTDVDLALLGPITLGPLIKVAEPRAPNLFDQESTSWAIFAQGTYSFTDTFRGTLGLRYNEEEKDLDKVTQNQDALGGRGIAFDQPDLIVYAFPATGILIGDSRSHDFRGLSRDEEKFTWSGNLQWDVGDDTMLYASISTGFKGGGYDAAYNDAGETVRTGDLFTGEPDGGVVETGITGDILEYDDETVLAYEVGAKMGLLEGAATLNIAVFRMEYDDLQVSSLVGDAFRVGNAGEAISQGVEVDGRWLLTERWTIGASVAYLDAYFDDFTTASCTNPQVADPVNNPGCMTADGEPIEPGNRNGGQDLTDENLLFSPEWSANFNAEYIAPVGDNLELRINADVNYTDEFDSALDLDPNTRHDSATKVNARIALASVADTWSVALIGKNLTDETTQVWRNDVPVNDSNSYFAVPERPRSIAIQVRYRF
jgi:outer membrane receptor protein involved in Fe transport